MQTKTKLILYWTEIFSAPALGGGPWPHMATPISASALCDGTYGLSHGTQDDRELFVLRGQRGMEKGAHLGVHPSNGMHREEQVAQQRAPSTPPSHAWRARARERRERARLHPHVTRMSRAACRTS